MTRTRLRRCLAERVVFTGPLAERRTANPVVLTGDRHATWISDLTLDFDDPASPTVGAELTGPRSPPAVTASSRPSTPSTTRSRKSPHWKHIEDRRGYVLCDLDRDRMLSELRYVSTVLQPEGTTITTTARLLTEDGRPGVEVDVVGGASPIDRRRRRPGSRRRCFEGRRWNSP